MIWGRHGTSAVHWQSHGRSNHRWARRASFLSCQASARCPRQIRGSPAILPGHLSCRWSCHVHHRPLLRTQGYHHLCRKDAQVLSISIVRTPQSWYWTPALGRSAGSRIFAPLSLSEIRLKEPKWCYRMFEPLQDLVSQSHVDEKHGMSVVKQSVEEQLNDKMLNCQTIRPQGGLLLHIFSNRVTRVSLLHWTQGCFKVPHLWQQSCFARSQIYSGETPLEVAQLLWKVVQNLIACCVWIKISSLQKSLWNLVNLCFACCCSG